MERNHAVEYEEKTQESHTCGWSVQAYKIHPAMLTPDAVNCKAQMSGHFFAIVRTYYSEDADRCTGSVFNCCECKPPNNHGSMMQAAVTKVELRGVQQESS